LQVEETPLVAAVVLSTNESDDATKCIASLLEASYSNLRIILVDNASTDGGAERIAGMFPSVQIIRRKSNEGYSAGNNTGIRAALEQKAAYVLISNSDIVVEKDFLGPMVSIAERDSTVGLVVGTVRYQSNPEKLYYGAGKFSRMLCTGKNTTRLSARLASQSHGVDVDFVNGALFLARSLVFLNLGLLDESLFLYFDDVEFSRRYGAKYRLVYTPKSVVYHKSGAGKGWRNYTENYLYYHTRNRLRVFSNERFFYQTYVKAFSLLNVAGKTLVIASNYFHDRTKVTKQLAALWRGLYDGLKGN
jgi:GT2 family glycosyltransferase